MHYAHKLADAWNAYCSLQWCFFLISIVEELGEITYTRHNFTSLAFSGLVLLASGRRPSALETAAPGIDASIGQR